MEKLKDKLNNIMISDVKIDEAYPSDTSNPITNVIQMIKRKGAKPRNNLTVFQNEQELYEIMGCTSIVDMPVSDGFSKLFKESLGFPDFIFVDNDVDGVLLGCYYPEQGVVVYFGKEMKAFTANILIVSGKNTDPEYHEMESGEKS